eukprot:SM000150S01714  [mRNA]  locus=s150:121366:123125:- [translate_table: standard]
MRWQLLANKRVALLGDSLSDQVYTMFLISLQRAGYEEYITQLGRMYSCNGTMHDTSEETLRKFWPLDLSHSDEVINWHDRNCDTWIQTSLIGGPFNITWKYWRTYKLPTKEGIKNSKYVLWPGVLDYLFEDSDIVVVNLGAHYGEAEQEELALHYEQLAVRMEAFNRRPGRLAFFRQTLAQHFYSTDGTGRYKAIKGHLPIELTNCHAAPNVCCSMHCCYNSGQFMASTWSWNPELDSRSLTSPSADQHVPVLCPLFRLDRRASKLADPVKVRDAEGQELSVQECRSGSGSSIDVLSSKGSVVACRV